MDKENVYEPLPEKTYFSTDQEGQENNREIVFSRDTIWVMKIVNDNGFRKILFNTKDLPDLVENDFAKEVIDILHRSKLLDDLIRQEAKALIKKG